MQSYEFSLEEVEVLRGILRQAITSLDVEVFRTDTHDFKEMLKRRRQIMERILTKLPALPALAEAA
jgi:hypothetical protein